MNLSITKLIVIALSVLTTIVILFSLPKLFEDMDASEIMVIQHPISGELTVYTDNGGWKWQGFGSVTKYPRRMEFKFGAINDKDLSAGPGLEVRFYDGGNAVLQGTMSWLMPLAPKDVIEIHKEFRSAEAFEHQAIRRSMESAATFSGPTMTSFDSAAGRRNELLQILNDQTLHGVYKTVTKTVRSKDLAGIEKDLTVIEIVKDEKGMPMRAQESYVQKYNVTMLPMTISKFNYEARVEDQIKQQQAATNQAIVSASTAKKADQEAITAESEGRRNAATAKWAQEVENAKTVAMAQARVTIADAAVKEAEAFKKSEILRGEGEAARKKAVMEADGQLDKKLDAWIKVNAMYAGAIEKAQPGAWSPQVVMGQNGAQGGSSRATDLVDLMTAKTAKDLGVDMGVVRGTTAKK
jgi:hypothetical protein